MWQARLSNPSLTRFLQKNNIIFNKKRKGFPFRFLLCGQIGNVLRNLSIGLCITLLKPFYCCNSQACMILFSYAVLPTKDKFFTLNGNKNVIH